MTYKCDHWFKSKRLQKLINFLNLNRKRKWKRNEKLEQNYILEIKGVACTSSQRRESFIRKRQRTSFAKRVIATRKGLRNDIKNRDVDFIQRWIEERSWFEKNFKQNNNMTHLFIRKRLTSSFDKHESNIINVSLREEKNFVVKSRRYE